MKTATLGMCLLGFSLFVSLATEATAVKKIPPRDRPPPHPRRPLDASKKNILQILEPGETPPNTPMEI